MPFESKLSPEERAKAKEESKAQARKYMNSKLNRATDLITQLPRHATSAQITAEEIASIFEQLSDVLAQARAECEFRVKPKTGQEKVAITFVA